MTDIADDKAMVLYDIDVDPNDVDALVRTYYDDPERRWYARRRLQVLTAAVKKPWNEKLHPRGPDGRFIETGGWVRWLLNGLWRMGKVVSIDPDTGFIHVRPEKDKDFDGVNEINFTPAEAKSKLYKAPSKKAALKLPNPKTGDMPGKSWKKIGGQGGSNPGGRYKVLDVSPETGNNVYKSPFGIAAGYFGKIMDNHGGDFVQASEAQMIRGIKSGDIYAVRNGEVFDAQDTLLGPYGPKQFPKDEFDHIAFPSTQDFDAAWNDSMAYAGAISANDEFYIKTQKSVDHSINEALANYLYELAGVNVPDVNVGDNPQLFASKIVPGEDRKDLGDVLNDDEILSEVRKNLAIDAWLANWDVVGLGYENIQIVDGVPYRIDAGGGLLFRAQGAMKGAAFGNKVGEIDTLRDPGLNAQAAKVFGGATEDEIMDGLERLAGISPEMIHATIDSLSDDNGTFDGLGDKLVARRKDLLSRFNVADPWDEDAVETAPSPGMAVPQKEVSAPTPSPGVAGANIDVAMAKLAGLYESGYFSNQSIYAVAEEHQKKPGKLHLIANGKLWEIVTINMKSPNNVAMEIHDPHTNSWQYPTFVGSDVARVTAFDMAPLPTTLLSEYEDDINALEQAVVWQLVDDNDLPQVVGTGGGTNPVTSTSLLQATAQEPKALFVDGSPGTSVHGEEAFIDWEETAYRAKTHIKKPVADNGGWYFYDTNTDTPYLVIDEEKDTPFSKIITARNLDTNEEKKFSGGIFHTSIKIPWDEFTHNFFAAYDEKAQKANNADPKVPASDLDDPSVAHLHNETINELDKKAQALNAAEAAGTAIGQGDEGGLQTDDPVQEVFHDNLMPGDEFTPAQYKQAILDVPGMFGSDKTKNLAAEVIQVWAGENSWDWGSVSEQMTLTGFTETERGLVEANLLLVKAEYPQDVSPPTAPEPTTALPLSVPGEALPHTPDPDTWLSSKLVVGDKFNFHDWADDPTTAEGYVKGLVGKVIVIPNDNYVTKDEESGTIHQGGWGSGLTGIYYVESYDEVSGKLKVRSTTGAFGYYNAVKAPGTPHYFKPTSVDTYVVDNVTADDFKLMKDPVFKSDGTIVANGVVIGKWEKDGYYYSSWSYEIDPQFSIYGAKTTGKASKKTEMKKKLGLLTIPFAPPVKTKKKSPAAKKVAAAVETPAAVPTIDMNPGGVYSDGTKAQLGDWVKSTKGGGGFIGKIVSWPNQEQYPGLVFAVDNDGVQKAVNLKTQKKVDGPESVDLSHLPNAYTGITLKDGKTPSVGQKVTAGEPGKAQVKGIITNINPNQGWVYIQTPEGKKVSKTYSVVTVDEEPDHIWDLDSALAQAAAATPTPKSVKTKTAKKGVPSYPGPDGYTIPKDEEANAAWLAGHPNRKLTKDGYAPKVGMRIRTSKGEEAVVTLIANEWDSNPNKLTIYNLATNKKTTASANTVQVDHAAEGYGFDGNLVQKVSEVEVPGLVGVQFEVPEGYTIYRYKSMVGMYSAAGDWRQKKVNNYVAVAPDSGKAYLYQTDYNGTPKVTFVHIQNLFNAGNVHDSFEKVAVLDKDANQKLIVIPHKGGGGYGANKHEAANTVAAFAPADSDPYLALNTNNHEPSWGGGTTYVQAPESKASISEPTSEPEVSASEKPTQQVVNASTPKVLNNLETLPDVPAPAKEAANNDEPNPPTVTANDGAHLNQVPGFFKGKVNSVMSAAKKMISQKDSTAQGTGDVYAVGDSDYIEDMALRFHVAKKATGNGDELVLRFRLREDRAEDIANTLMESSVKTKKGKWVKNLSSVYVDDLKDGDKIHVYKSSTTNLLKPKDGPAPTVTVKGVPVQVGESNGFPLYRVTVVASDGSEGEVDIERRASPSLTTYMWDPDAVVSTGSYTPTLNVTTKAAETGWTREGGMRVPYKGVTNDKSGKPTLDSIGGTTNGGGSYLHRPIPGGSIHLNVVHASEPHSGHEDQHRPNLDGEVRIHVPLSEDLTDEKIQQILATGLESVGVPVEKQMPASSEQLTLLALEKLVTQYHPKYKYRDTPITGPEDKRVTETLQHMNLSLKTWMDRPITLDDLRFHTWDTGRIQVVVSPEVANAIAKNQKVKHFNHNGASSVIEYMMGGPNTGLMSTDERWSLGILTHGMSSSSDLGYGSGDRVYMHGVNGTSAGYQKVIFNPAMIATSTEVYLNQSDGFGARKSTNDFITHQFAAHEYMYKRKLEIDQIAYITTNTEQEREHILKQLRDRDVHVVNGRKIEDIIVTSYAATKSMEDDYTGFLAIGMDLWKDDLPVTQVMGGPEPVSGPGSAL